MVPQPNDVLPKLNNEEDTVESLAERAKMMCNEIVLIVQKLEQHCKDQKIRQ